MKGATGQFAYAGNVVVISIHAPVKGATELTLSTSGMSCDFNPRSREGSDIRGWLSSAFRQHFNPRSREGSDLADRFKDRSIDI